VYQVEALDHAIGLGMSRRAQPVLDAQMRGLGSMVAIEFRQPQTGQPDPAALQRVHAHWSRACCDSVVSCGLYGQVIRLPYPLTIEDTTFEKALTILANALEPGDFSEFMATNLETGKALGAVTLYPTRAASSKIAIRPQLTSINTLTLN
jgi:hypothetical protein